MVSYSAQRTAWYLVNIADVPKRRKKARKGTLENFGIQNMDIFYFVLVLVLVRLASRFFRGQSRGKRLVCANNNSMKIEELNSCIIGASTEPYPRERPKARYRRAEGHERDL